MSPRLRAGLGSAAFAVGALVMFAGLMTRRPAALLVGAPICLAGLVLVGVALRQVAREIGAASLKSEASLRQLLAEKKDGPPPS